MKKSLFIFAGLFLLLSNVAHAESKPVNLALVDPVQIFDDSYDITGFRFNLLYGKNTNVKGLDLGIGVGHSKQNFTGLALHYAGNFVQGDAKGVQFADFVNINLQDFSGFQFAGANYTQGNSTGVQFGYVSIIGQDFSGIALGGVNVVHQDAKGFKLAIVNYVSGNFGGLQIGLVNIGGLHNGFQLGLININKNKKPLPFFPFINFSFGGSSN